MVSEINNALPVGAKLHGPNGTYCIEKTLGAGGFGITYLAVGKVMVGNVPAEVKFAIKEHFPSTSCKRDNDMVVVSDDNRIAYNSSLQDFVAEAKKLHALGTQNENIVKVNEVFEANNTAYYVMQYINGESLQAYIKSKGKIPYADAVDILAPIFNAVDFLHSSRINHLDIKPENIMLHRGVDGITPILIDFGLSVHFKKSGGKTSPKGVEGVSEGYSPLEQYAGINEFNPATDIYALTATLLFALTGKQPKSAAEIRMSEVRDALANVAPQNVIDGICKAMAKSDEDRTSSVKALKADLGLIVDGGSTTRVISVNNNAGKPKSYVKIGIMAVAAVVLAVLAIVAFKMTGCDPQPKDEPVVADTVKVDNPAPAETTKAEDTPVNQPSTQPTSTAAPTTTPVETQTANPTATQTAPKPVTQPAVTQGTLSLGYGSWTGGIKNGKPDGKGQLTFYSSHRVDRSSSYEANPGDYFIATYDNGSLISGKLYDSTGSLIATIIP